ncbi:MAG: cytochrome c [Dehalococcoidia bacterium]|nr:cytochrome c [Dehalococcoidia bacterium]
MFGKLRVPPGPILGAVMMSGLAFTLVVVIIARSPYTHGNLSAEGYNRTNIIYVGQEQPYTGIGLADPSVATTGDPVQDGRVLFFRYGCASCHGLNGDGGAVGPELSWASGSGSAELARLLKGDPKDVPPGMPFFGQLSEEEIESLSAFLRTQFP